MAPTFAHARALEDLTGLPVIGSVGSYAPDVLAQTDIVDRRKLTVAFAGLAAVCAVVVLVGGAGAGLIQRLIGY
jgi:hypothetical protein